MSKSMMTVTVMTISLTTEKIAVSQWFNCSSHRRGACSPPKTFWHPPTPALRGC